MLLFGEGPTYLSHLPTYECPHNFQVLAEVELGPALEVIRADRTRHGDGIYTFDPSPFPIAELEPGVGAPGRTAIEGTLVRGHFERGGTPIASGVRADVRHMVWFSRLDTESDTDTEPVPGRELRYLCFGCDNHMYLVHELRERPSFDQVLSVRLVPGTVRTQVGHPLDDDVSALRFEQAQPVSFGRGDGVEHRLGVGEVVTASFPATRSPSFSRGFTLGIEVERQLYLEIGELA